MSYFRSTESIEQVLSDSIALSRAILTIKSISLHKFLLGFQRYEFHSKFRDNVTDNEILSIQINIQYITYLWKKKNKILSSIDVHRFCSFFNGVSVTLPKNTYKSYKSMNVIRKFQENTCTIG